MQKKLQDKEREQDRILDAACSSPLSPDGATLRMVNRISPVRAVCHLREKKPCVLAWDQYKSKTPAENIPFGLESINSGDSVFKNIPCVGDFVWNEGTVRERSGCGMMAYNFMTGEYEFYEIMCYRSFCNMWDLMTREGKSCSPALVREFISEIGEQSGIFAGITPRLLFAAPGYREVYDDGSCG